MSFMFLNFLDGVTRAKAVGFCDGIAKARRRKESALPYRRRGFFKNFCLNACGAGFEKTGFASLRLNVKNTLSLLVVIFPILFISNAAFAMSQCPEEHTFERRMIGADFIFKGHLKDFSVLKYEDSKEESRFNFNKKSFFLLAENYVVDEAWKNTKKGETISVFFCMPLEISESDANQFLKSPALSERIGENKIWLIKKNDDPMFKDKFNSCDCDTGSYDVVSKYESALNMKFPRASKQ